jgi:hypothetical protein
METDTEAWFPDFLELLFCQSQCRKIFLGPLDFTGLFFTDTFTFTFYNYMVQPMTFKKAARLFLERRKLERRFLERR